MKFGWPRTWSAVALLRGVVYSSPRLFSQSATYRRPSASSATPVGPFKLAGPRPPWLAEWVVKLPPWPKTRLAVVLVRGVSYSSTRLLPLSVTYRRPCPPWVSSATPNGPLRVAAVTGRFAARG